MRKLILMAALAACLSSSLFGQYPANFSWLGGSPAKEDQIIQGPCNIFATIAGVEAWYGILYGSSVSLSQQLLYSPCVPAFSPPSTDISDGLAFIQGTGVCPGGTGNSGLYWGDAVAVTCTSNCSDPYWGSKLNTASLPCSNPLLAPQLYKVANYQSITLPSIYPSVTNNYQKLQRALLNDGPIMINMRTPTSGSYSLHCGATHAYLLFGWTTDGALQIHWKLKDSWPASDPTCASDPQSVTDYPVDIIAGINTAQIVVNQAYILTPTVSGGVITKNAVYQTANQPAVTSWPATASGNNFAIGYTLPDHYLSGSSPLTATLNNLGQLDAGYTVSWSSVPAHPGAIATVAFGSPNSTTTSISAGIEGYAMMQATVTLPNGIKQSVNSDSFYVCAGIPVAFQNIWDVCSGTTRSIRWQIVSRSKSLLPSNLQITWNNFFGTGSPTPTVIYNTSDFPNDIITVDWPGLTHPTGYSLRPSFVDPNYNNITDGTSQSGSESACSTGHSIAPGRDSSQLSSLAAAVPAFTVYPNPSAGVVYIQLPLGRRYVIKLYNSYGSLVGSRAVAGSASLDLTGHAKGVYLLHVISADPAEGPIVYKVILK